MEIPTGEVGGVRRTQVSIRHKPISLSEREGKQQDRHNTKAHYAAPYLIRSAVKSTAIVRFRLWQSAKWRGGKYGLVPLYQS